MNKFEVGQRVKEISTGKIGQIILIDNEDFNRFGGSNLCYRVQIDGGKYWFTINNLEEVKGILDAEEREYLSNVIKPFRDRVNLVRKSNSKLADNTYYEVIEISIKSLIPGWKNEVILLPAFHRCNRGMYKNMEIGKEYTLEELGL